MSEGACTCGIKNYCSDLYHKCLLFHSFYHFTYPKCPTTIYPTQPHPPSFYVSSSGYCVVVIHVLITILPIPKCTTTLPSDCHQPYPAHLLFSLVHFSSAVFSFLPVVQSRVLPDPLCKGHILLHDSNTLSVDGTEVGILEQSYECSLRSFLNAIDSSELHPMHFIQSSCFHFIHLIPRIVGDFLEQALKRKLFDEKIG